MERLTEGYGLVEGPVWDPERGLLFSDVVNGGVFVVESGGRVREVIAHRRGIGGMTLHERGGLVVSGRNVAFKDFDGGPTVVLLDRDEAAGNVGYNDLTTDAMGRIYVGSLGSSPVFDDGRPPAAGDLFCIDLDGTSRRVGTGIRLTNGLAFSPDNRWLYHSDSIARTIWRYGVHEDGGLEEKEPFIRCERGAPDGLVVSEDGRIWAALAAGGAAVGIWNDRGEAAGVLDVPQPMCTSVCFGGSDLRDLYVVTGSEGSGPNSGAVYVVKSVVAGLPVAAARVAVD